MFLEFLSFSFIFIIPLAMGWIPCDGCSSCTWLEDNFDRASVGSDWTQVTGSWSVSSNQLSGPASGLIVCIANPSGSTDMSIIVDYELAGATDEARVIINYADSSNYNYLKIVGGTPGSISIHKVVAGTHTQITIISTETIPTSDTVRICQDDINTTASIDSIGDYTKSLVGVVPVHASGDQAGMGCGSGAGVKFDNFIARFVTDTCGHCIIGDEITGTCCGLTHTLPLVKRFTGAGWSAVPAVCPCSVYNGTFFLGHRTPLTSFTCDWQLLVVDNCIVSPPPSFSQAIRHRINGPVIETNIGFCDDDDGPPPTLVNYLGTISTPPWTDRCPESNDEYTGHGGSGTMFVKSLS